MKKRRVILAVLLALVLLFAVSMAVACDNNGDDPNQGNNPNQGDKPNQGGETPTEYWVLQSIALGGTYKTEYQLDEAFSANGLTVTATVKSTTTGQTRTDNVTDKAKVDSSRYNPSMVGTYVITVSYADSSVTRYAHYSVSVAPYEPTINGITMTKTTVDYDIPQGQTSVSVNVDDITVKAVGEDGKEAEAALSADDYALTYYLGGQKVDSLANATKGTYTIQAERKSDGQKAFVIVYVFDPAVSIAIKSGTREQGQALLDNMSADWIFTVTNRSGATRDVTVADVEVAPCNTLVPGKYSVNVNYSEYDGKGQETAISTKVEYTVTRVDGMVNQSYAVNFSLLTTQTISSETVVLSEEGGITILSLFDKGDKEKPKSKIADNKNSCGTKTFTKRFQFGGTSHLTYGGFIKLELKGPSLVTVCARAGSAGRELCLYGALSFDSEKLVGTTEGLSASNIENINFLVEKAGTYYLAGPKGDIQIYYLQVDTVLTGAAAEGQQNVNLPTATEMSGIVVDTTNAKTSFTKGEAFTYEGLVVSKKIHNPATADDITEVITEGYTVSTPNMSEQGKPEVTVTYQGNTAKYTISVNSYVDGVNGIKVTLPTTTLEVENASDTVTLSQDQVTVKTDSGAAIVIGEEAGQCATLVVELYSVGETDTLLNTLTVGVGTYKVKVIATYNNTANTETTVFTDEITFTVKAKSSNPPSSKDPVEYALSANDLATATLSAETPWLAVDKDGNSVSVMAASGKEVVIDGNSKAIDGISFTKRIKLGGTGSSASRCVKITVADTTTITIYAMSAGTGADKARPVTLANANGTNLLVSNSATLDGTTTITADTKIDGDSIHKIVVTVEAGTYYFYSLNSGFNVYGINLKIGQAANA